MPLIPITSFLPVQSRTDSTEIGKASTKAQNVVLRPRGAISTAPILHKLWGFGTEATPFETFAALTNPFAAGTIGADQRTICVRIYLQGKSLVMFFNMWTGTVGGISITPGERGTFYIGDDGTGSGFNPLADGPPLFEIMAVGLDPAATWYGTFAHGQLNCQNGVDDALAIQLGRTLTPGKLRKRASNATPSAPVISLIEPQTSENIQAKRTITDRVGDVPLVFTAHRDNFAGEYGNNRIRVRIVYGGPYSSGVITSTMTGDGTPASPYLYTLYTTLSNSSNNAIIAFVASDSRAKPILSASGADATADPFDDPTSGNLNGVLLAGGSGTGSSVGLSNEIVDIYARFWDGGHKYLGYEAPSSPISNQLILDGTMNKDVLVLVDIDESKESGRFSHANAGIRIYKRFQTGTEDPIYSLMNPLVPLVNTHREKTVMATCQSTPMWEWSESMVVPYIGRTDAITLPRTATNGLVFIALNAIAGIPSGTRLYSIFANGTSCKLSTNVTPGPVLSCTVDPFGSVPGSNYFTDAIVSPGIVANGAVYEAGTNSIGLPTLTPLYVIEASQVGNSTIFKLSTSPGGSAVNLIDNTLSLTLHPSGTPISIGSSYSVVATASSDELVYTGVITNGARFEVGSNSLGIPPATLYSIEASTVAGITTFKLSTTLGGSSIDITDDGTITLHKNGSASLELGTTKPNRLWSFASATRVTSSTNPTSNTVTLPFVASNGDTLVCESSLAGIPSQTKLYVTEASTPSPGTTTCKLALRAGGTCLDILSSTTIIELLKLEQHQWSTRDVVILPHTTAPTGLSLNERYFVGSVEPDGIGITLSASRITSPIPFTSNGANLAVKCVATSLVIGSNTDPGRAMSPDQNRPPPHRYIASAGTFNWCAGFSGNESMLLSSKDEQFDELSPEGVDLEDPDFITKSRGSSAFKITGLWSDKMRLHVHCIDGIVILNPADTNDQQEPLVDAGMANGSCVITSDANRIVFLASDGSLREFNGARYGNRSTKTKTGEVRAYISQFIDTHELSKRPEACCVLDDESMVWFWLPSEEGNVAFAFDTTLDGLVGPFTAPLSATSTVKLEPALGQFIITNRDGYLFSWDIYHQPDHGDILDTDAPGVHETTDELPDDHAGYQYNDIEVDGLTKRLWYSSHSVLETGYIDAGSQTEQKKFTALRWRGVYGSRAHVRITFISHSGAERSIWYGEMGAKYRNRPHQVRINMVDTAIKLRIELFSADHLPWIIRDLELMVE